MADHDQEPRLTAPIVPGPEDELSPRHRAVVSGRRARTWPLWLLCLLLLAGLAALAGRYWLDRQAWQASQRELSGQVSNLHARLDSLDDSQGVSTATFEKRMASVDDGRARLRDRLDEMTSTLKSLDERTPDRASLDAVNRRLDDADQQRSTLADTLNAVQRSMTALEQQSGTARQALATRLSSLETARQTVAERLDTLKRSQDSATGRLDTLAGRMDSLAQSAQARQSQLDKLASRVDDLGASLTELRQNQVALSASLEALRGG
ncbi:hypothetical protein [Modicisalibacter sp. 'Wilcox']|uniref:hypothetical protein n=1 Tax=Modicisalibacter sp. 'Wilcox' TaxID=2679914 RepID=UPI0013D25F91|nr:hypothetical protein [Modicisalibacter sp. 'Wilcox']